MVAVIRSDDFELNRQVARHLGGKWSQQKDDFTRVYYRNDFSNIENRLIHFAPPEELKATLDKLKTMQEIFDQPATELDLNTLLEEAVDRFDEDTLREKSGWEEFKPFIAEFVENLNAMALQLEQEPGQVEKNKEESPLEEMQRQLRENEFLTIDGGRTLLILLTPTEGNPDSFSPYEKVLRDLRRDIEEARQQFPGADVGLTGEPVLLDDEMRQSTIDSIKAAIITFIGISLLFFVAYRELVRPALAILALVVSISWTMGITVFLVGHLNIISQACIIMLLGLGIDFGIQMLGRYEEELTHREGIRDAVRHTLENTGVAVLTGGGTTAVAFFTMCFNDFLGLQELGIISGAGIVMSVLANLLFLPALLVIRDRRRAEVLKKKAPALSPAFRRKVDQTLYAYPLPFMIGVILTSLLAAFSLPKVGFDYNLLNLQNPDLESVRFEKMLINDATSSTVYGIVVAEDREEAAEKSEALKQLPTVSAVRSINDMLPSDYEEKLPLLANIDNQLKRWDVELGERNEVDVEDARDELQELLSMSREGLEEARKFSKGLGGVFSTIGGRGQMVKDAIEVFEGLIPPLERSLTALRGLSEQEARARLNRYQQEIIGKMKNEFAWLRNQNFNNPILLEDLPIELRTRYVSANGKCLVEIDPKENVWLEEPTKRFVADLKSVAPGATGTPVQNLAYINLLRESYIHAAGYAFLAIVILISLHFRNLFRILLTLLPLALGMVWTGATMVWCNIPFNPANIITLPLVIGIGVAFGVYVVDRHREEGKVNLFGSSTGKAILLSALTTMTGFFSMTTGDYVGLQSLGQVMCLGILFTFLSSVLVLPQLLTLIDQRQSPTSPSPTTPPSEK
jgi:hopanoid biosynthesis associated RND transporter like protein HpnN